MLAGFGGLLLLSNQWVRVAEAPRDQATPASLEMMQLLHDEHQLIGEMVKAQLAVPDSGFLRERRPLAWGFFPQSLGMDVLACMSSEHFGHSV